METKPKEITPAELKQRWKVKKSQIGVLANNIQSLRLNLTKDLKEDNEKVFLTALVISIMDKTAERVGNDESANNGHFGITGLEKKHIKISGDKIHLKYKGKSGVEHEKEFTDSKLADALKRAIANTSDNNVFTTSEGFNVNAAKVNRYLKDYNVRAKDIRGYSANKWVIEKLRSKDIPKEEKDRKKVFLDILKSVSEKIGHGKTMLRNQYLVPGLEKKYIEMGKIIDVTNKESYEKGGPVTTDGKNGGWLKGNRHYSKEGKSLGGIPAVVGNGEKPVELEGGEVIINREASKKHWKELSRINQSAGGGVPIGPPEQDTDDYKEGGKVIEFNPNHLANRRIYDFAKMVKSKYPKVWDLGGNIFGNEAFVNLERAIKRGYWIESEKWMYVKWRAYVARHKGDYQIAGVIAMLKWIDKVEKGWPYMKKLIEDEIKKRYSKDKKETGGGVEKKKKTDFTISEYIQLERENLKKHNSKSHEDDKLDWADWKSEISSKDTKEYGIFYNNIMTDSNGDRGVFEYMPTNKNFSEDEDDYSKGGDVKDITCKCGWSWNKSDSKKEDEYVCHKCGADNKMKRGGEVVSFIKGQKYSLKDKKFNKEKIVKYSGFFEKNRAKYHKFTDRLKGESYNIHPKHLEDYEITAIMKDGGELTKGIKAEQEHIGTLEKLYQRKITPSQGPKQIAEEHLKEDKNYYTKLKRAKLKTGGLAIANWFRSKPKVSDDVLYNWAKQRLDINLLNWTGFDNKKQYEEQMNQTFVLDDFIKDFRPDLEETYIRRNKANMIEMGKRGGAINDNWVSKEDERMGFSVHGLTRTANPSVMLHTLFDVVPTLERGLKTAENMYKVDPKLGRVEVQGKATRKLYYIITLSEDGTYDIKSSQNETLNSLQFSNVADIESPISDNRAYIRAKLFGETDNYKEPEDLKIGDIVLIDKVKENGYRGYVKVTEKDGYIYKGVGITMADNPARQDFQIKNATQKFSIGNVSDNPSIQDEENLKIYKTRIKNQ